MTPRPASTVVLAREAVSAEGSKVIETLLLLRNTALKFEGGAWVFPGGKIDPEDYPPGQPAAEYEAARNAIVRETREEAGLHIAHDDLIHIAHWTTPEGLPRRYSTWFFFCPLLTSAQITVDDDEILDYQWLTPQNALSSHQAGQIRLPIPTRDTLAKLLDYSCLNTLSQAMRNADIHVFPRDSQFYRPRRSA